MRTAALVAGYRKRFGGPSRMASGGAIPLTVTFPASNLVTRVWLALAYDPSLPWWQWGWADVTEWVRKDLGITVDAGRRNESTRVNSARCQLKFDNRDGRFVRRNPLSPYFGLLTRNTPIWIELNPGDGFRDRFHGFVNEWPTRWTDPTGNNSYVTVQCAGVMRRLGQGVPLDTSLNRTILADNPVAYWRMDDPTGSTRFESALTGGDPLGENILPVYEGVDFGTVDPPPGADDNTADFSLGSYVYTGTPTTAGLAVSPPWTVVFDIKRPADGSADGIAVVTLYYLVNGAQETSSFGVSTAADSQLDWNAFMVRGVQNGANWEIHWWRNATYKGILEQGVGTLGNLYDVIMGADILLGITELSIAFLAVYASADIDAQVHSDALQAFTGEQAHIRIGRIAGELGISFYCQASASAACGPQPHDVPPLDIMRDAERTDQGVLYEREFGLAYQALSERYNQPVGLELDFAQKHISGTPEAVDDDQRLRNRWSIRNSNTGTLRTAEDAASIAAEDLYDDQDSVNLADDDQIYWHAAHRVWVGTTDEDRWPRIPLNFGRTPDLISAWTGARLNDRVTVASPPAQMAPDAIDVIIEGYSERWDQRSWSASLNTSPARPYQTGVAGDSSISGAWAQTSDAVLAEDLDTTETAVDITSTDDWADASPGGEPLVIGGEVVALTAVSGSAPNWTLTVTRSVNGTVKSHSAGAPVRVHRPLVAVY